MIKEAVLRKVCILEKKDNTSYFAEDIFTGEKLLAILSGKMRMNYIRILSGDIVYIVLPNKSSTEGRLIFEKYICLNAWDSDLCKQKREIERREKLM